MPHFPQGISQLTSAGQLVMFWHPIYWRRKPTRNSYSYYDIETGKSSAINEPGDSQEVKQDQEVKP